MIPPVLGLAVAVAYKLAGGSVADFREVRLVAIRNQHTEGFTGGTLHVLHLGAVLAHCPPAMRRKPEVAHLVNHILSLKHRVRVDEP